MPLLKTDMTQKNKYSVLFLLILIFAASDIHSLDFRFDRIDSRDGLAGNSVSGVIQDKRGFIWFATQDGFNRYDGKTFRLFEHEPFNPESLPHNLIQTIYYDETEDLIWLGTYRGVCILDPVTERLSYPVLNDNPAALEKISLGVITAIEKDMAGNYWIGTLDGLIRINWKSGESDLYNHDEGNPESLPHKSVRDILCDSDGRVWIATYNGISRYNRNKFDNFLGENTRGKAKSEGFAAMSIAEITPGTIVVGTWGRGVVVFNTETGEYYSRLLSDNRIYNINKDSKNHIWAGSWGGGLFYFDSLDDIKENSPSNFVFSNENKYSLSNDIVYSFFEDKSGLIWIGTNGGGVNKLNLLQNDNRFLYFTGNPGSIGNDRFKFITIDQDENLWIGSYNTGLYIYDIKNRRISHFVNDPDNFNSISDNVINSIFIDSRKNIWVLTNSGLDRFDAGENIFEHFYFTGETVTKLIKGADPDPAYRSNEIFYAVTEDIDGRLWLGTYNNGIYVWDMGSGETAHYTVDSPVGTRISDNMIYSVASDKSGDVWIGTNNGLNRYDNETGEIKNYYHNVSDLNSLCHDSARVLFCDTTGNIWIGTTGGGLSLFNREQGNFYNFNKKDGLEHNTVIGIVEDQKENIIAVTLKGISLIERKPENKFTTVTSLTYQFGLSGVDFKGGVAADHNGNIYVTATGEIYKLDTSFYYLNTFVPEIIITDLKIFDRPYIEIYGKNIFSEDGISLKWDENYISFDFTSIDYTFPSGRKYKYMLEGFDRGWIFSGERNFASYTSIPPGRYKFRVTGTNSSGYWSTNEAFLSINIIPPFYDTPLAYLFYFLLVSTLFYGIIMIIRGKEAQKRLEEVSRLKDELEEVNLKLDKQTRHDSLTGVHNRKHFNEVIENLWDIYTRTNINFAIIMLDIDYFKIFNDTYGHIEGDRCLKEVAEVILDAVSRKTDSVFRYGGEEFALLLVDTEKEGAKYVANKIRTLLGKKKIANKGVEGGSGYLTVSIGIACTKGFKADNPNQILAEADKNLYKAKEKGRNTIV